MCKPTPSPIRVLLVDDHAVLRQGLAGLIHDEPSMILVGEAASCSEGLQLVANLLPDVAVIDLSLPDASGIDLIQQAQQRASKTAFVVLTSAQDPRSAIHALDQGTLGYVLKDDAFEDVVSAICSAYEGRQFLSRSTAAVLFKHQRSVKQDPINQLTAQEIEVLKLIASDFTNKEIAAQLGVESSTVKSHRLSLRQKLNMPGTAELTRLAIEHRLIPAD